MHISIITLFPEMFSGVINSSILKRAQEKGKVIINIINLRDYGIGSHKSVDDKPYGGGVGMVLKVDVVENAINKTKQKYPQAKVVLLDPKGKLFSQKTAEELSTLKDLIFICGHYEGIDERIHEYIDIEISLGDFILTGGEIPTMAVIDAISRLLPGVLGKEESHMHESFSETSAGRILEHPHYTRPAVFKGKQVPEVLLSGDPKLVNTYRSTKALEETKKKRSDLIRTSS